jgi:hypothetical protein
MIPCTWTKEEDAIIIENKKDHKTNKDIAMLLPGKIMIQVNNRSRFLINKGTLKMVAKKCLWTKEEDAIIIENRKDNKTNKDIAMLLEGKSYTQVNNRSSYLINEGTLNPRFQRGCTWTKEEDAIIIENKKDNKTNKDIAMLLKGRSHIQVNNRSRFLIDKGTLNPRFQRGCTWTKEEDAIIISNKKDNKTNKHIVTLLEGKSESQVKNHSYFLIDKGVLKTVAKKKKALVTKVRPCTWTKEEDAIIISNKKDNKTNKDIATLLEGKSRIQVNNRSRILIDKGTLKTVAKKKKAPVTKVWFHINK